MSKIGTFIQVAREPELLSMGFVPMPDIEAKPMEMERLVRNPPKEVVASYKTYSLISKESRRAGIYVVDTKTSNVSEKIDTFFLTTIQQSKSEKVQLTETFDENSPSLNFFGKKTSVYAFGGSLINTEVDVDTGTGSKRSNPSWVQKFQYLWDNYLRASILAKNNSIAMMVVDNEYYEGYPITFSINKNSMTDETANFSMSWIIINHDTLLNKKILGLSQNPVSSSMTSKWLKALKTYNIYSSIFKEIERKRVFELKSSNKLTLKISMYKDSVYYDPLTSTYKKLTTYDGSNKKVQFTQEVKDNINGLDALKNLTSAKDIDLEDKDISTIQLTISVCYRDVQQYKGTFNE